MERRAFIATFGGAAACPVAALAQKSTLPRIGWIALEVAPEIAHFRSALRALGYFEGKSYVLEERHGGGDAARVPSLVGDLLRLKVDVIVARGIDSARAAAQATQSMPVVVITGGTFDIGAVATLARPGRNVTGLHFLWTDLAAKRLDLAREALPALARAVILTAADTRAQVRETVTAAEKLRIAATVAPAHDPADLDAAFRRAADVKAEAVVVPASLRLRAQTDRIIELALRHRIAVIGADRSGAEAGFLLSYGPDLKEGMRRGAAQVDRILKGTKPADIPVEQSTKIELVVNLKTAKALGLTVPSSLLARADEVIE